VPTDVALAQLDRFRRILCASCTISGSSATWIQAHGTSSFNETQTSHATNPHASKTEWPLNPDAMLPQTQLPVLSSAKEWKTSHTTLSSRVETNASKPHHRKNALNLGSSPINSFGPVSFKYCMHTLDNAWNRPNAWNPSNERRALNNHTPSNFVKTWASHRIGTLGLRFNQ
jgi:hypothetical protein